MFILEFFRDFLDGFIYYLYVAICIFAFFYVFGFVANRKRKAINDKLKEKKQYDIASGKEAAIAAMETKQVLNVEEDPDQEGNPNATLADATQGTEPAQDPTKKEEVPAVMVINSSDNASTQTNAAQTQEAPSGPQVEQPLVIDTSTVQ